MGKAKNPGRHRSRKSQKSKKRQDDWDKKSKKNFIKAYNKAVDYANNVLIPTINKKYGKYDWSSLDTSDLSNIKGDPKLVKAYRKYIEEHEKSFLDVYQKNMIDLIGERPE